MKTEHMDIETEKNVNKHITFFETGGNYREALEPIAEEATNRGYETTFTDNLAAPAEIGVYSVSPPTIPRVKSKLSVISFHGIDSGYGTNSWHNWSRFDVGLLAGQRSAENWQACSVHPAARPNIGVFNVGWPKSDPLFDTSFRKMAESYREKNNIGEGTTVLYAPSFECNHQMDKFVDQTQNAADNLLIKHAPYDEGKYIADGKSYQEIYKKYEKDESVHILDRKDNIFYALHVADIVVSDSLSVFLEGILTDTIPMVVLTWKDREGKKPAKKAFPDFVWTTQQDNLEATIQEVLEKKELIKNELVDIRGDHYEHLGRSSEVTMQLIDAMVTGKELPITPIDPRSPDRFNYIQSSVKLRLENTYLFARGAAKSSLSKNQKDKLEQYGVGRFLEKFDRFFRRYNR